MPRHKIVGRRAATGKSLKRIALHGIHHSRWQQVFSRKSAEHEGTGGLTPTVRRSVTVELGRHWRNAARLSAGSNSERIGMRKPGTVGLAISPEPDLSAK